MDKQIKDYTREELKEIILDDSKKMNELYPNYRWGQAVFNYVDEYLGVARKVQFEYNIESYDLTNYEKPNKRRDTSKFS